jgi:hypothetical protein
MLPKVNIVYDFGSVHSSVQESFGVWHAACITQHLPAWARPKLSSGDSQMCRARSIHSVAASYASRGHAVRVLSATRVQVTDAIACNVYRVTDTGRAVVGTELAAEIKAESDEPEPSGRG